jgi:excisionase family DNA binding protein
MSTTPLRHVAVRPSATPRFDAPPRTERARPPKASERQVFSIAQACEYVGCEHRFWRKHIAPTMPIVRLGRARRVLRADIDAWLAERAHVAADDVGAGDVSLGPPGTGAVEPRTRPRAKGAPETEP